MSGPIATLDPTTPKIPDELWRQSGISLTGWMVRGWIALVPILVGWILADVSGSVYAWALAAVGVAAFFAVPGLVRSLVLARLSAKVDAIEHERDADRAHAVLDGLRNNTTVKLLAPHGWLRVQEGRVYLAVGNGRAAAKSFAEAERVSTYSDKHALVSAQAHALTLAGDRKEARELLGKLRKADALSDLDRLNFGVVLLSESGHNQEALGYMQQAREAFGDHPRALAGLMLALQRCDKNDEAAALLGAAEAIVEASDDPLAPELLKRAKKGLRPVIKLHARRAGLVGAKQKRERKSDKPAEPSEAASVEPAQHKAKGKKGRKQARRDARKKAKAEARRSTEPTSVEQPDVTPEQVLDAGQEQQLDVESEAKPDVLDLGSHGAASEQEPVLEHEEGGPAHEIEREEQGELESPDAEHPTEPDQADQAEPVEPPIEPPIESPIEPPATPQQSADEDGVDLATLALEALGSGSRRKLDDSKEGPSASGVRSLEPGSSGSMFRSAVFDEPTPAASGSMFRSAVFDEPEPSPSSAASPPSLFSLPKFDSVPTFAPPPKPTRGPVLPSRPSSESTKPEPKPEPVRPVAAKPVVPGPTPPKLGALAAPSIPAPKPVAVAKPAAPALDDWGDLGDVDPLPPPPVTHKIEE